MTEEIWKPVPIKTLSAAFEVSNLGNIRHAPRRVPSRPNGCGYRQVTFKYRGHEYTTQIQRLVLTAFGRPPEENEVCNHINCDRSDNRLENLEWTTHQGNSFHSMDHGLKPFGTNHPLAKIDPEQAYKMRKDGKTFKEIAEEFGCSPAAAWALLKRVQTSRAYKNAPWKV